jgi:hypothetical protein
MSKDASKLPGDRKSILDMDLAQEENLISANFEQHAEVHPRPKNCVVAMRFCATLRFCSEKVKARAGYHF